MYAIILIAMYYVLFHPFFINGQEIQLSFNTSVYEGTNNYYAHIGEDVVLNCTIPSADAQVFMSKGRRKSFEYLVFLSKPVGDLISQMDKYSLQSNNGQYHLIIHNLEESDSLPYRCGFRICTKQCGDCPQWCRFCPQPCEFCTYQCTERSAAVRLDVKDTNDGSMIPDFCELLNSNDGIFFTGNNLTLRCPNISMNVTASIGSSGFSVDVEMEDYSDTFTLLRVKSLTTKFNGTTLSCISVENGDVSNNYCRYFPTVLVFNGITVLLLGGEGEITNGENVTLTCHSHPFSSPTIEWDILDSNVRFGNMIISEANNGNTITFTDLQFHDSSSSRLTVFCNVTIGSEKSFGMTSLYPGVQVVSSTHVEFIESSTPFMNPSTYVSPVIIAIPTTFACIALGIVIVGLIFIKVRKPEKKEQLDRRKVNIQEDVETLDKSPYYIEVTNEIEVGLEKKCPAQDEGRRRVEGSSYYNVGNNATTIGLESHTAAHIPSNGVYESGLPAIYINDH